MGDDRAQGKIIVDLGNGPLPKIVTRPTAVGKQKLLFIVSPLPAFDSRCAIHAKLLQTRLVGADQYPFSANNLSKRLARKQPVC